MADTNPTINKIADMSASIEMQAQYQSEWISALSVDWQAQERTIERLRALVEQLQTKLNAIEAVRLRTFAQ